MSLIIKKTQKGLTLNSYALIFSAFTQHKLKLTIISAGVHIFAELQCSKDRKTIVRIEVLLINYTDSKDCICLIFKVRRRNFSLVILTIQIKSCT